MATKRNPWEALKRNPLLLPIVALVLMLVINVIITPSFFKVSIRNGVLYGYTIDILNRACELIILAVGMTLVVASSRGTDISVGAIEAVAAAVCIRLLGSSYDAYAVPVAFAIFICLFAGAACGAFNGLLVSKFNIQPMIATLILFTAGRGIAQLLSAREINGVMVPGQILYVRMESFKYIGGFIPGCVIPTPVFIAAAFVVVTILLLKKTALGMYIATVGINPKAGRLVGINSTLVIFFTYVFCGFASGLAGLIASSRIYSSDANNIGLNMELDAILAVALGGNSLGGGKFNIAGSVIGAITIQALTTGLYAMGVSADQLPVYKAVVVVLIVTLQSDEFKRIWAAWKLRHATVKETV
jgi:galactofuranose transport system permease protein